MRSFLLSVLLAIPSSGSLAQEVQIDPSNQLVTPDMQTLAMHIGGRVFAHPLSGPLPAGATGYTHQWPGVYFEAQFDGSSVFLKFSDLANNYQIVIDDLAPIPLVQPGAAEVAITGLPLTQHQIRLEKISESDGNLGTFDGFYLPKGATGSPAQPKARQIEFIGDSDMVGYGVESSGPDCSKEERHLLTNTQIAYPALLAKRLNADYQINAISGRGIVRNYGGSPVATLPSVYAETLPEGPAGTPQSPSLDARWRPQMFLISLGENDFSTPLESGEKWATNDALVDDYVTTYKSLLADIYQHSPEA